MKETYRRVIAAIRNSPILSGGLTVYAIVGGLIVLFAIGAVLGGLWAKPNVATTLPEGHPAVGASGESTSGAAAQGSAPSDGATKTADTGAAAKATGSVADDLEAVASAPDEPAAGVPDIEDDDWLESRFGAQALPASSAGFVRAEMESSATTVTGYYTPPADSAVDSLRLVVARAPESMKKRAFVKDLLSEASWDQVEFDWGERSVSQGMTLEDHPELYPPVVMMVWLPKGFGVQVTVIPTGPGVTARARAEALALVSNLPY